MLANETFLWAADPVAFAKGALNFTCDPWQAKVLRSTKDALICIHRQKHGALEEAAQVIEDRAKELIGHQQASWPPLKPETVAHKVTGDSPLLETGEMRDSIGHVVDGHEAVIGSDLDKAVYQEMGTEHIPPRSFLGLAAHEEGHHVAEMIGEHMANYLAQGDLMSEVLHLAHKAFHELKDTAEEILHDDEKTNDR